MVQKELEVTGKIAIGCVLGLVLLLLLLSTFGTIGAGERGVLLQFTAVTGTVYDEGLYFKIPLIQRVVRMDVKIQKEQIEASAASSDLQTVTSVVALNYHLNPERVANIYQEVGVDYKSRIIDPAMQEAIKASTAQFTAEELITKREVVKEEIKQLLREKLQGRGIIVDEFNIVDFDFSKVFNEAIEMKVTAEQQALAAKNKLEQVKFEAQQRVEEAKGKADAITIEANALRDNPQLLELRALEKWDGRLPYVTGGGIPFVSIPYNTNSTEAKE